MKIIKILDTVVDMQTYYSKCNTDSTRGLVGFIIKTGQTTDPVLGGAFLALVKIEQCMFEREIYSLYPVCDRETERKILHVVQLALDGKFANIALNEREKANTIKFLNQPL